MLENRSQFNGYDEALYLQHHNPRVHPMFYSHELSLRGLAKA